MSKITELLNSFSEGTAELLDFQAKNLEDIVPLYLEDLISTNFEQIDPETLLEEKDDLSVDLSVIRWLEDSADKLALFKDELREDYSRESLAYIEHEEKDIRSIALFRRAIYVLKTAVESKYYSEKFRRAAEGYQLYTILVDRYWKYLSTEIQELFKKSASDIIRVNETNKLPREKPLSPLGKVSSFFSKVLNASNKEESLRTISPDAINSFIEARNKFAESVITATKRWKVKRPSEEDAEKLMSLIDSWQDRYDEDKEDKNV